MRSELHRVQSDCYKLIYDNEGKKEETLELVVPDRCGDIGRILDVRAQLYLVSKKLLDGEAHISSRAELCVIFCAEETGAIEYVTAELRFEQQFSIGESDCELFAQVRLASVDARALNPRKLLLRAECCAHARCYTSEQFTVWDGFELDSPPPAYIQKKELIHSLLTDLREKSFTISDEYTLPAKYSGAKMLSTETELSVYDVKPVGNKLVFKANANTAALFLNTEDGSVFKYDFSSQFSQIIEIDATEEAASFVFPALKETEFVSLPDREGVCFSMRLTMTAQAICQKNVVSSFIADAYSTSYELSTEAQELSYTRLATSARLRIPLKGKLPSGGNYRSLAYITPISVNCMAEGASIICRAELCGFAENEDGELVPLRLTLSAEEQLSLAERQRLELISFCGEPLSVEQGGEVSLAVTVEYSIYEQGSITAVRELYYDEEKPINQSELPSLTVLIAPGNDELWTLAKKYGSTVELITAVNSCGEDFSPSKRPLLIPRA